MVKFDEPVTVTCDTSCDHLLFWGVDTLQFTQKKSQSPCPTKAATNAQNTDHKVIQFFADSPSTARGIPLMVGEVIGSGIDLTCVQLAPLLNCANFITLSDYDYGNTNRSLWSVLWK